jgi:hypothetical protein
MARTRTTWTKGEGGKPKGAKDRVPRSARRMVEELLERLGSDPALIESALTKGITARPPSSFPYLKLVVEKLTGAPEQTINLPIVNRINHERIAD